MAESSPNAPGRTKAAQTADALASIAGMVGTYTKQYMRLSYAQQAKGLSEDIQQHAQDMMDDPDVGVDEVEQYIDATTSGAIQGIDDPDAVDVFANRLARVTGWGLHGPGLAWLGLEVRVETKRRL